MIDISSFVPIYEQVKREMKSRILRGILKPKDTLPPIRDFAQELLINPNTVARAYRDLEQEGFITTRVGKGCFVSANLEGLLAKEKKSGCNGIFDAALSEAAAFGLDKDELRACFEERLRLADGRGQGDGK